MPSIQMPFDIISIILNLAYGDNDAFTLKSCAMVDYEWHVAARSLIFHRVKITTAVLLAELEALLDVSPDIGPIIRTLVVQPRTAGPTSVPSPWLGRISEVLPLKLTKLRHLELANLHELGDHCHTRFFVGCTRFTSVDKLAIRNSAIELHLLYAFICAFPNLIHLGVGTLRPLIAAFYPFPPQILHPRLLTLTINIGPIYRDALTQVLTWLKRTPSIATLRTLALVVQPPEAIAVGKYLKEHGALLEDLSLRIPTNSAQVFDAVKPLLELTPCSSLRSLSLYNFMPGSSGMESLLAELSSPHLEELRLGISSAEHPDTLPDFALLANVLRGDNLSGLKKLAVLYRGPLQLEVVQERVQQGLPPEHRQVAQVFRIT